jgi:anti-sigma B factor antagonist
MNIWRRHLNEESSGLCLVGVRGRLDHTLTPQLEKELNQLIDEGHTRLIVDLTEVQYINSGGLRCLVSAWRSARQQQGNVTLCGLNNRLQEVFGMVGFDKVFQIFADCNVAQQAMENR